MQYNVINKDSMENRELIKILNRYKIFEIGIEQAQSEILALFNVSNNEAKGEVKVCEHPLNMRASVKSHGKDFCWECGKHL